MKNQRICIIGDGLTGLTTCLALKNLNIDIDFYSVNKATNKSDKRITAISDSNYNFLKEVDKKISNKIFWPCNKIQLYHEDNNSLKNFLNFEEKSKKLMHIFENSKFKKELYKQLKTKNIRFKNKIVKIIDPLKGNIIIDKTKISYDLIILCLGSQSPIYNSVFKKRSIKKDYSEIAITGYINHKDSIKNPAQYFLKEGPLAILPFSKKSFSFVWSLNKKYYKSNEKNLKNLALKKISSLFKSKSSFKISELQSYPIYLNLRSQYFKNNTLILGEGLHSIHPIAGQGFNLVLRDIKKIFELVKNNLRLGLTLNNSLIFKEFYSSRKPENILFGMGVDLTNSFFKKNYYLDPFKTKILENISKIKKIRELSKIISDKGISL